MTERIIKNYGDDKCFYARLTALADLLNLNAIENGSDSHYWVDETYLDYGQDWMWTTILKRSKWGNVQVLCPRDWKALMDQTVNPASAVVTAYGLVTNGKYFSA